MSIVKGGKNACTRSRIRIAVILQIEKQTSKWDSNPVQACKARSRKGRWSENGLRQLFPGYFCQL